MYYYEYDSNYCITVQETKIGKELIIEGVYVESPRAHLLVKPEISVLEGGKKPCFMCALDLDLKYTDVKILSQFQRTDGCALPSRITGLCKRQQRRVVYMIRMAQKAGNVFLHFCYPFLTEESHIAREVYVVIICDTNLASQKIPTISPVFVWIIYR